MEEKKVQSGANKTVAGVAKRSAVTPERLVEEIRMRAYDVALARGNGPGSALDDWLKAEKEIKSKYKLK